MRASQGQQEEVCLHVTVDNKQEEDVVHGSCPMQQRMAQTRQTRKGPGQNTGDARKQTGRCEHGVRPSDRNEGKNVRKKMFIVFNQQTQRTKSLLYIPFVADPSRTEIEKKRPKRICNGTSHCRTSQHLREVVERRHTSSLMFWNEPQLFFDVDRQRVHPFRFFLSGRGQDDCDYLSIASLPSSQWPSSTFEADRSNSSLQRT